jgi:transglutaminase-like putative cysteine protease
VNGTLRRLGPDLGLLCSSVIAAGAVARLFEGGLGGPALAPLLVTAAVGCAVLSLLAFTSVPVAIRAVAGTVAVILTSLWTSFGNATWFGVPTARTWHALVPQLRAARPLVSQFAVPLHPTPGLVFLAAVGCGEVALLASVLLRVGDDADVDVDRRLFPGLALLGPLGLLTFACSQSTPNSMVLPVSLFVVAGALTMVAARASAAYASSHPSAGSAPQPHNPQRHNPRRWVTPGVLTAATVAAVVLVATLVGSEAAGSSGAGVAPAVPLTAESLTSKLLSVEVRDADVVLFQARSPVRTYWQVAVLDDLHNGVWVPDAQTQRAIQHLGHAGSVPSTGSNVATSGRQLVKSDVTISGLTSRLLPVPPGTFALSGSDAALTDVGAVATSATVPGVQYSTISEPPVTDPQTFGNGPDAADPRDLVQANTALPPLSPSIGLLARSITSGADGPLAETEELTNWFRSGQFHYTLDPPANPPGTDPLVSFLTQTRSGTCEQFAGAFVVLARSLGLPSRVVVGFTAGHYSGPGQVTVTGADAHAWPQVYLGQQAGWVSFEPTPQQPRGDLAADGVIGQSGVTQPTIPVAPKTVPAPVPKAQPGVPSTAVTRTPNSLTPVPSAVSEGHSGLVVLGWALLALLAGLTTALVAFLWRRHRRWSPNGRSPEQMAFLARDEVERALRRAEVDHPPWQPLDLTFEEMRRSRPRPEHVEGETSPHSQADSHTDLLVTDGITVARVADDALFAPEPIAPERGIAAYEAALRVRRELR